MTAATGCRRRAYIDWARGLAVLLMIEAHTMDAWIRVADRNTSGYALAALLGGFAAPMFLWLAGLGSVMSGSRTAARTGSRAAAVRSISERGLEIFLLAFLFRLQAFVVSPGSHPITVFRVDVLNVMGPAIVICALVFLLRAAPAAQAAAYAALAAVTSFATPIVRAAAWVDRLPIWLQWYVRPAGDYTTFTLFPWAGFVFAGAAAGALLVTVRGDDERRLNVRLALSGAGLVAVGLVAAAWPTMYTVPVSFWTSSPAFFIIRVGIVMAAVAALVFVPEFDALAPLATLGRSSLFIYWIHVELVYGYASWLWRHSLPIWAWMPAFAGFAVLMYRAIGWRDRGLQAWRQRSLPARTPVGTSS